MATTRNSLDKLAAGVSTRADLLSYFNSNLEIIDAAVAKCNFVAARDPTANDDSGDGYSAGSQWYNTTGHKVFVCENATSGSAIWRQIYPLTFWSEITDDLNPTRLEDTSLAIKDTGNANRYDLQFGPGTIIRWEKSGGGAQFAMVITTQYHADFYETGGVRLSLVGNTLSAGWSDMKYCIHRAESELFIVPGMLPGNTATPDIAKTMYVRGDIYVFSAKIWYKTAPTTTKGVWDINDDGTTIFTTKPEVAASATEGVEQVSDCLSGTATTAVADKSLITVDYDSGHATTPGADAYVYLFWMPVAWRYLS